MSSCGTLVSIVDESGYSCEIYLDYEIPTLPMSNTREKVCLTSEFEPSAKSEKTSNN